MDKGNDERQELWRDRRELLAQVEEWLELPMLGLAFAWLVLLVVELTAGLSPLLQDLVGVIWAVFILEFTVRLLLATDRPGYLRANWITAVALLLPALRTLRFLRVLRLARAARGMRLVRLVSSLNRGMRALRASMGRRGLSYVLALTGLVILVGAAGMYAFEKSPPQESGLQSYGDALWWTAMVVTTLGSEYWPRSAEGRLLCLLLAVYGLAVFGYITAAFAAFFIGRDAESRAGEVAGEESIARLHAQIEALRRELHASHAPRS